MCSEISGDTFNVKDIHGADNETALAFGCIEDELLCDAGALGAPGEEAFTFAFEPDERLAERNPAAIRRGELEPREQIDVAEHEKVGTRLRQTETFTKYVCRDCLGEVRSV